jgi:hypothetical protein
MEGKLIGGMALCQRDFGNAMGLIRRRKREREVDSKKEAF